MGFKMSIPRILHSGWIGPAKVPDRERAWCDRMKGMNPNWDYRFATNETMESFSDPYLKALLDNKEKIAFVMDRLRVLLLQKHGGVWLDADCEPRKPLDTLPIWDLPHLQFATGMRSPHRKEVALYRGVPIIDNTFLASAPNGHMVRRLLSLWTPQAPVVTGHRCGIAIMEAIDHTCALVNYRYFYAEQPFPESIVMHDCHNLASWTDRIV